MFAQIIFSMRVVKEAKDDYSERRARGDISCLRTDLIALTRYLGEDNLRDVIQGDGLNRCLEVGAGTRLDALEMLAELRDVDGVPVYSPDGLWVVDPKVDIFTMASHSSYGDLRDRLTIKRCPAEQIRDGVLKGDTPSFNLVFSRGVVSRGGISSIPTARRGETPEILQKNLREAGFLIGTMEQCLDNEGLMVLSTSTNYSILPFPRKELERLGLKVVHSHTAGEGAALFKEYIQAGIYPETPREEIFDLVICKRYRKDS